MRTVSGCDCNVRAVQVTAPEDGFTARRSAAASGMCDVIATLQLWPRADGKVDTQKPMRTGTKEMYKLFAYVCI